MAELEEFDDDELDLSDDLNPNEAGSQAFSPLPHDDPDQKLVEMQEKSIILGAEPLLDEIFKWLDSAIEDCDSIRNLDVESKVPLDAQLLGMEHAKLKLVNARSKLTTLKSTYIREHQ